MRHLFFALLLLAACTSATPQASDADTIGTAVSATLSAELETPPELLAPVDGATFNNASEVTLNWKWSRPLQGDEWFDVRVWQGDAPHYGITWNETSEFDLADWLRHQEPGKFFWSVAVIVGDEDGEVERTVSNEAPAFHFTVTDTSLPTAT